MTEKQISDYEHCKSHLVRLKDMVLRSPFQGQMHACVSRDSRDSKIEFELQAIHDEMCKSIRQAISNAEKAVNERIASI